MSKPVFTLFLMLGAAVAAPAQPFSTTLTVQAEPAVVGGATSKFRARLTSSGFPLSGKTVRFRIDGADPMRADTQHPRGTTRQPLTAVTDQFGYAVARLQVFEQYKPYDVQNPNRPGTQHVVLALFDRDTVFRASSSPGRQFHFNMLQPIITVSPVPTRVGRTTNVDALVRSAVQSAGRPPIIGHEIRFYKVTDPRDPLNVRRQTLLDDVDTDTSGVARYTFRPRQPEVYEMLVELPDDDQFYIRRLVRVRVTVGL